MPLIVPLAVGQSAVLDRDAGAESLPERGRDRRRQRNLGDEHDHAAAAAAHDLREPEVDLGLAAAGHAAQERDLKAPLSRQRRERLDGGILLKGQDARRVRPGRGVRPATCQRHMRRRKRIALDAFAMNGHESHRFEPGDDRGGDPAARELVAQHTIRRAVQQQKALALPRPEIDSRALRWRRLRGDCCRKPRRDVEPFGGEPYQANGPERRDALVERVRRHRRRQRRAGPGQVIICDPTGELNDVRRQKGLGVEDLADLAEFELSVRCRRIAEDDTGQRAPAERHDHAGAGHRRRDVGRDAGRSGGRARAPAPRPTRAAGSLLALEDGPHLLHVFPDLALGRGIAQQVGRVERRDQRRAAIA